MRDMPLNMILRRDQKNSWIATIGEGDENVEWPSTIARGCCPLDVVYNLEKTFSRSRYDNEFIPQIIQDHLKEIESMKQDIRDRDERIASLSAANVKLMEQVAQLAEPKKRGRKKKAE